MRAGWNGATPVQDHYAREQAGFWEWTQGIQDLRGLDEANGIRNVLLNIRSGWVRGLKAALQALQQRNAEIRVLQETKLTQGIHMLCSGLRPLGDGGRD